MTRARDTANTQDNVGGAVAPFVAGKNVLINGGFDIFQRNTTFTSPAVGAYLADRWYNQNSGGAMTVSRQSTGAPNGSQYVLRVASTGTNQYLNVGQLVETSNVASLWGQTTTFSVKLRKSSAMSTGLELYVQKSSTIDASNGASWTTISTISIATGLLPTGTGSSNWYTASISALIPNDGTANTLRIIVATASATLALNDYWEMSQAQLELGNQMTPFSRAGGSIGGELALCQRYYERISAPSNGQNDPVGWGIASTTTTAIIFWPLKVTKRVLSSTIDWSGLRLVNWNTSGTINVTTASAVTASPAGTNIIPLAVTATGMSTGLPVWMDTNGTTGYLGVSAEL